MIKELIASEKFLLVLCGVHLLISAAVVISINWIWATYFIALAFVSAATYFVNDRFIPQEVRYAFKRKITK